MHVGLGIVTAIHEDNIKNAKDILANGTKEQITHLFKIYNSIAKKGGAPLLSDEELAKIISSRGFKGFGDIDWGAIGDIASKIGSGLATAATAVGPLILQKYQIDKLPSVTPPAAPPAPTTPPSEAGKGAKGGTDWTTIALVSGGVLVVGGVAYFFLSKRK